MILKLYITKKLSGKLIGCTLLPIGKDPQSIHRLEAGKINPSYVYLTEVCEGLGIEVSELLKGI